MRCHVATSCHVVWLFVLISGCWGKCNPFPHSRHGTPGLEGLEAGCGVGTLGQELGGDCPGTPEVSPCCVTGYTLPSLGLCCSAARSGLKISLPRAQATGGGGRSLEKYLSFKGRRQLLLGCGAGQSIQFSSCLLSTYCVCRLCPTLGCGRNDVFSRSSESRGFTRQR